MSDGAKFPMFGDDWRCRWLVFAGLPLPWGASPLTDRWMEIQGQRRPA